MSEKETNKTSDLKVTDKPTVKTEPVNVKVEDTKGRAAGLLKQLDAMVEAIKKDYSDKIGFNPFFFIKNIVNPVIADLKRVTSGKANTEDAELAFAKAKQVLEVNKDEACKVEVGEDRSLLKGKV